MPRKRSDAWYIKRAKEQYTASGGNPLAKYSLETDDIEIDDHDVKVSQNPDNDGAFVQAWVWVYNE